MNLESDSDEEDEVLEIGTDTTATKTNNDISQNGEKNEDESNTASSYNPSTKLLAAEESISNNEWNIKAWEALFTEARSMPAENITEARAIYERFLSKFPTSGRYWKFYAEHEASLNNTNEAQKVIQRGLAESVSMELWRYYIEFVIQQQGQDWDVITDENTTEKRDQSISDIEQAYEHCLDQILYASDSTGIWTNYIEFLKSKLPQDNHYEMGQRVTKIRSAYRRALSNPIFNIESIWQQYEIFERGLVDASNKILAERLLKETQSIAMANRTLARELQPMVHNLVKYNLLAIPAKYDYDQTYGKQLQVWKKIIKWEMEQTTSNIEQVKRKARVRFQYKRCLCTLRHFPTIWYEFAKYEFSTKDTDAAFSVYQLSSIALPTNLTLGLAHCDFLEQAKKLKECQALYKKLQKETSKPLVWIQYQQFIRRNGDVSGKKGLNHDEKSKIDCARKIFKKARNSKDGSCTWHVFVAAANMELRSNKQPKIAHNIFELGLKKFNSTSEYALEYIKFLMNQNDDNGLRTLLERVIPSLPKDKCKTIFRIYLELELRLCKGGGDLSAVEALEKRFYEMYPNDLMLEGLNGIRYRYNTLGLSPDGDDESSNGDGNVGQTSSSSYMYTNMADPLFNSERVKVVGVPVADGNGVDNEKYICVPAFLGKLTTYLPILSQSINPLQDVKNVLETFRSMPIPEKPDGYDKYLEEKTKHISNGNIGGNNDDDDSDSGAAVVKKEDMVKEEENVVEEPKTKKRKR